MTEAQRERLPGMLREIVDLDRRIAAELCGSVHDFLALRELRERRFVLRLAAQRQYGRAPLRGDTGPGRPTAAAA